MNQFEAALYFYGHYRETILAAPRNEWAIDAYSWEPYIRMTPIEACLWGDIREANAVFYPQWPESGFFLDFANPVAKVAIECDGRAFHLDRAKDAARDDKLGALGWKVFRISGSDCMTDYDDETREEGYAMRFVRDIASRYDLIRSPSASRGTWMFQEALTEAARRFAQ